ncbi:helix-turn-helix domain-containing protein [Azospirillum sp. A29]|uniref:helix-turn-helix domain-containing protein n=1 Tax=unclassified Azospirillum TaxID=2630922 RepID=UPI00366A7926
MEKPELKLLPEHVRAARALLDFSQREMAERGNMAKRTIIDFERGLANTRPSTKKKIYDFLVEAGIECISDGQYQGTGGIGVRIIPKEKR